MTDALDAAAAAGIAALQGDTEQLQPDDTTVVLAVLEERRSNLVGQRTRSVNQLHAVLRELIAGGAPPKLSADKAAALLRAVRPLTAADRARKQVARDLVAEIRGLERQLAVINNRLQDSVTALGSRLPETVGVGPVIAGRPLGRTGRASRFPTAAHFASYTGAAPLQVASGRRVVSPARSAPPPPTPHSPGVSSRGRLGLLGHVLGRHRQRAVAGKRRRPGQQRIQHTPRRILGR